MNKSALQQTDSLLTEWLLRFFGVVTYVIGVHAIAHSWWIDRSRWTLLLLMCLEAFTCLLLVFARRASSRDLSVVGVVITAYAAFYFFLLDPTHTHRWIPEWSGAILQVIGMLVQLGAKVSLGRSFGLLPAARRIVVRGPYRWVRHPMYLGYLIAHVGFLLVNMSLRNGCVLLLLYLVQWVRILREESQLNQSESYRIYSNEVRWRLIPGVI